MPLTSITPTTKADKHWGYHAYTIWLFTRSDLKTTVIPGTVFGILVSLAIHAKREGGQVPWARELAHTPLVMLWVWINLLPFDIDNQRQPDSIMEDRQNKPWRPMPSGRMGPEQARVVVWVSYFVAIAVSIAVGGLAQCFALLVLGYGYNDRRLADWHWVTRNGLNALGFCSFASGALEVALRRHSDSQQLGGGLDRDIVCWLAIIAGVVFSTVQTQDMADQIGDRLRGRVTLPLGVGDGRARWLTALPVAIWSIICPSYWGISLFGGAAVGTEVVGLTISCRLLLYRTIEADKRTFRLWNLWMAGLYMLPLWAVVVT